MNTYHPDSVDLPYLRAYLQRIVGDRGKTMITAVRRYASWADLPWDEALPKPEPLPPGRVILVGMRDVFLGGGHPGPEGFVALPEAPEEAIAAMLANQLITARRGAL